MNVFVNYDRAGELERSGTKVQFTYQPECRPGQAVSLMMPVCPEPYLTSAYGTIHPVFDMNIPEGYLYEKLQEMFSKVLPAVDKLVMLELVGRSQIGRLRVAPSVDDIKGVPARSLKEMLVSRGTDELFADLVKSYARYSGIAGVQPKVLAKDSGTLGGMKHTGLFSPSTIAKTAPARVTAPGTTHIVKMCDPKKFPSLATNEFLCLRAAKQAGLPAPDVWLGENRRCLIVARFDIKPDGAYLAFEDLCALRLMQSQEKYLCTCEQAARTLSTHISTAHVARDMRTFFESVVLSVCLRNGDAHLKNFGVLYDTPAGVRLSPIYDIVSTTVYLKKDVLALALGGSQMWPASKRLLRFGVTECGLARQEAQESIAKMVDAVETVRQEIPSHIADTATGAERQALRRMDGIWQAGVAGLTAKNVALSARLPERRESPRKHSPG
jgi:serine/threonine-protein kinase HipA